MSRCPHLNSPPLSDLSILAGLVLMGLAGCGASERSAAVEAPARPVLVAVVEPRPLGGWDFVGEVRARQRAELAFSVAGVVREVLVEPGDPVRAGQLLARLDPQPAQAQWAAAQAEVSRWQASLAEAERRHARLRIARGQGAASEAEWTAVQAELQTAHAALAAARAQQEGSAWSRQQTELRAPINGHVGARHLEVGQSAGAGTTVLAVDGSGRELQLMVPASLGLRVGQTLQLLTPTGPVASRVLGAAQRLEAGLTRRVQLSVPEDWQVGDAVSVRLAASADQPPLLQMPLRAVQAAEPGAAASQASVLKLAADGRTLQRVAVELGASAGALIEVRSGLSAGDQVVVAGAQTLEAGARVAPVTPLR